MNRTTRVKLNVLSPDQAVPLGVPLVLPDAPVRPAEVSVFDRREQSFEGRPLRKAAKLATATRVALDKSRRRRDVLTKRAAEIAARRRHLEPQRTIRQLDTTQATSPSGTRSSPPPSSPHSS